MIETKYEIRFWSVKERALVLARIEAAQGTNSQDKGPCLPIVLGLALKRCISRRRAPDALTRCRIPAGGDTVPSQFLNCFGRMVEVGVLLLVPCLVPPASGQGLAPETAPPLFPGGGLVSYNSVFTIRGLTPSSSEVPATVRPTFSHESDEERALLTTVSAQRVESKEPGCRTRPSCLASPKLRDVDFRSGNNVTSLSPKSVI